MKHLSCGSHCQHALADCLVGLPLRILSNYDKELAHLVLYQLGHDHHFGLESAAYLIDNPDFDCLQGKAGITRGECFFASDELWHKPSEAYQSITKTPFNTKVCEFTTGSLARNAESKISEHMGNIRSVKSSSLQAIGSLFGLGNSECIAWPLKHGNFGILLFDRNQSFDQKHQQLFMEALALLGFCPIG